MSVNPLRSESAAAESTLVQGRHFAVAAGAIAGAAFIAVVALAVSQGSEFYKAAESRRAAELANENRMYCEKWGMRETTAAFAACAKDLDDIRARHGQRINADMSGMYGG